MSQYYSLYFYKALTPEIAKKLASTGVIVPYDSFNPTFNVYAYVPINEVTEAFKSKIKGIAGEYNIIFTPIDISQIQKQSDKIDEVTALNIGDKVNIKRFKKLQFTINHIQDDTYLLFHKLRDEDLVLEVHKNEIIKPSQDEILPIYTPQYDYKTHKHDKEVVIDCDSIPHTKHKTTYYIVRHILFVKNDYHKHNVVVANPLPNLQNTLRVMGVKFFIGDVRHYITHNRVTALVTNNIAYHSLHDNILNPDKYPYSKLETEYNIVATHIHKIYNKKFKINEALARGLTSETHQLVDKYTDITTFKRTRIQQPIEEVNIDLFKETLTDIGLGYLADISSDIHKTIQR